MCQKEKVVFFLRWVSFTIGLFLVIVCVFIFACQGFFSSPEQDFQKWYPHFYSLIFAITSFLWLYLGFLPVLVIVLALIFVFTFPSVKNNWRSRNALLLYFSIGVATVTAEILLRKVFHIYPGQHTYSQWFTQVDTLISLKGFSADADGIYKVDNPAINFINEQFVRADNGLPKLEYPPNVNFEAYSLDGTFLRLRDASFHNQFSDYVKTLHAKPDTLRDAFENEVLQYANHPVNPDGFRSISFQKQYGKRKKILLLGDSFTWGHSSQNLTSSFADILLSEGYAVYNTGVSGADPAQYLAIAEKYIRQLKPDYVVVNFFMGNDIMYFKRDVLPYHPYHFATNAGNMLACPDGVYFDSPKDGYDFIVAHYAIPPESWFNKFCSLTAVTTLGWKVLAKFNIVSTHCNAYKNYWQKVSLLRTIKPYSNVQVNNIKSLAEQHGAKFILLAISDLQFGRLKKPEDFPGLFDSIEYYSPPVQPEDYKASDGHYNEEGHRKHAEFIRQLVNTH